jgi:hypothetical protein
MQAPQVIKGITIGAFIDEVESNRLRVAIFELSNEGKLVYATQQGFNRQDAVGSISDVMLTKSTYHNIFSSDDYMALILNPDDNRNVDSDIKSYLKNGRKSLIWEVFVCVAFMIATFALIYAIQ